MIPFPSSAAGRSRSSRGCRRRRPGQIPAVINRRVLGFLVWLVPPPLWREGLFIGRGWPFFSLGGRARHPPPTPFPRVSPPDETTTARFNFCPPPPARSPPARRISA